MEVFMSVLVCFLAAYGVFQMLYNSAVAFSKADKVIIRPRHQLIVVKDDYEGLEGYIRSAESSIDEGETIVLLNCSKDDDVSKFLEILEGNFCFVKVMTPEEYIEYVKGVCHLSFE